MELSLDRAIYLAINNSESLKKAQQEIERTEALRKYRSEKLDFIPTSAPGTALTEIPWSSFLAADLTWRMSQKSFNGEQDKVVLDVCKKYWDVIQKQEKLKAANLASKSAEYDLNKARASFKLGLLSSVELQQVEAQIAGVTVALATARNDLDNAFAALNQTIGLSSDQRPILMDSAQFIPLEVSDLDAKVRQIVSECPSVWLSQEKVTMQKYLADMVFYTGEYRPYEARRAEITQASLDATNTVELFEQLTRSLYFNLKSLEEAYTYAQDGMKVAKTNLEIAQLKYRLGMITLGELTAKEKAVAEAEAKVIEVACQYSYAKLAFQKPWASL